MSETEPSFGPARLDHPYRGPADGLPTGVPFPPDRLPLFRKWTLRKRWHYVSFWSPEILLCIARVNVGPLPNEYWGVWDRTNRRLWQGKHYLRRRARLEPGYAGVLDGPVTVELPFEPADEFEVYRPERRAYIWSRKSFATRATATVRLEGTTRQVEGTVFVDVNAGYHPRRTRWHWSAGVGTDQHGRVVAWNAITGLFDTAHHSERTVWIDGSPTEIGPVTFSRDLTSVAFSDGGDLRFTQEADLRKRVGLFLIKSKYDHAFGSYSGSLPGGIELREGFGVRERQDALW